MSLSFQGKLGELLLSLCYEPNVGRLTDSNKAKIISLSFQGKLGELLLSLCYEPNVGRLTDSNKAKINSFLIISG